MSILLYGKELSPPCRSVLVVAKVLGIDMEIKDVDLLSSANKSEEFLKMNPSHTIPTLDDNGFYLWESRAIMSYLVQTYGKDDKLYPKDLKQRALVDNMLYFDIGSLFQSISLYFFPQIFAGEAPNSNKETSLKDKLSTLNKILEGRSFSAGDQVTIADISIVTSLSVPTAFGFEYEAYPNIVEYIAKVKTAIPVYDEVAKSGEEKLAGFVQSKLKK